MYAARINLENLNGIKNVISANLYALLKLKCAPAARIPNNTNHGKCSRVGVCQSKSAIIKDIAPLMIIYN